jgi:UDP-N-acetylglucosamine 4,6-dehydratase
MFKNKVILVTGGTGSFGKTFIKKIKSYQPKKIIIFSRDEQKQHDMQKTREFKDCQYFLGDVRDYERLKLATRNVDILIHAAALKIVPSLEYNPFESVKTNINGTNNVIRSTIENNVNKVVLISTDKAVNPTNLYGACKMTAEKLFIAANNISGDKRTRFSVIRYGNVLGSRGSIVEILEKNKKNIDQIKITDTRMTRFLMTLDQCSKFVLDSIKNMSGGEIFVPKLPSVKILDIFKLYYKNIKINVSGIREGEKIHEVLISEEEMQRTNEYKNYFLIYPSISFFNFRPKYLKNKKIKKNLFLNSYNSHTNPVYLDIKKLKRIINN